MNGSVVPEVLEDLWLEYKDGRGADVRCRARLFKAASGHVLIATDAGYFVTQTIDRVATIMVRRWELEPAQLRVVEHFARPSGSDESSSCTVIGEPAETFALVGFSWQGMLATNPSWRAATRREVQELLGGMVAF
jgi:hypothetical protein